MKIFLRLLRYARPVEKYAIPFFFFSLFQMLFGVLNLALLIPVLELLFKGSNATEAKVTVKPEFEFDKDYFIDFFYYNLNNILDDHGKFGALVFVCSVIAFSVFLSNIFRYFSSRVLFELNINTLLRIRKAVFNKVMSMHVGYFSNQRKGEIINKVTGDVQVVQNLITSTLLVYIKEPIAVIMYFSVLIMISPTLVLFTLLMLPISGLLIAFLVRKLKKHASEAQHTFGLMISHLDEAIGGFKIVKAFNATQYTENKFHAENIKYTQIARTMSKRQELASPVSEFMGVAVILAIVLFGGSLVLSAEPTLTGAEFIGFVAIFSQAVRPIKSITNSFSNINTGMASAERVIELLDMPSSVNDNPDAVEIKEFENELKLNNVSFAYEEREVLKNVNITIPKGKTIALVGPSGGGKSTISDLIPRFYDPHKGSITIDGIDLRDCQVESIRAQMGIVSQEAILFNDSIFNNIAFGKPTASKEEVINAAKIANAHEFILQTDQGYDTYIGDRGVKLSGGQKQRLSIARAVLKNPPILLLDEATSALDTESEKVVQDALDRLMENRTTLVIAHRLSTITNADQIIVIQDGQVVEQGTHNELVEVGDGVYRKLRALQNV